MYSGEGVSHFTHGKEGNRGNAITLAWLKHAWDGFPREVWDSNRTSKWQIVESPTRYVSFLNDARKYFNPAHTSINIGTGSALVAGYSKQWISKFLLEFDGSLDEDYSLMRRSYALLKMKFDAVPRVYFSGHKSFHVFVDFTALPLNDPAEAQREFAKKLASELSVQLAKLDYQAYAERKLSRVPYTIHEKTAWDYCVPVSPFWSLGEIKKESQKPNRFHSIEINFSPRIAAAIKLADRELDNKPETNQVKKGQDSTYWIERLLAHPIEDGRHRVLWHVFAPYLLNVRKLPPDQAEKILLDYFTKCGELKRLEPSFSQFRRQIRYYLKQSQKDGYPPWHIETIQTKDPPLYDLIIASMKGN